MADYTRYVDTGAAAGGNGTTNAVSGANCAYQSLAQCEAAEQCDLTAAGKGIITISCARTNSGAMDTTTVTFAGWTTSSSKYIFVTQSDFPTNGKYDSSKYVLYDNDSGSNFCFIQQSYVRFEKFQFRLYTNTYDWRIMVAFSVPGGTSDIRFSKCIFTASVGGSAHSAQAISCSSSSATIYISNCTINGYYKSGGGTNFCGINSTFGTALYAYNSVVTGCSVGVYRYDTTTVAIKNCAVFNNEDDFSGTGMTIDYCASDDGDGTHAVNISPGATEATDWAAAFTDYANGDFSIKDSNSVLYNAGTDNPGSGLYSDDIIGTARSSTWDIGAFEYVASGNTYTETVNDSLGITDAATRTCTFARTLTESMGTTDSLGRASMTVRALAESLGITDSLSKNEGKTFSDAMGIVDTLIDVWTAVRSFADTISLSDTLTQDQTKALVDSIGITDTPVQVCVTIRVIADSLGLTDDLSSVWQALRTIADSLGLTDAMSEVFEGAGVFLRTIDDSVGMTDATTRVVVLLRVLTDNLGLADAVSSVLAASRIISDAEGLTDGLVLGRMIAISDPLGLTDDVTRLVTYLRTPSDTVGLLDAMARVVMVLRTVDDTVGLTDQMRSQFGALIKAVWAFMMLKHR